MAEDLHKDDLEDFFKDSFENETELPAKDGWDSPSSHVWEKIDEIINEKDDSDKGILWFNYLRNGLIALFLLMLIVGAYVHFYTTPEETIDLDIPKKEIATKSDIEASSQIKIEQIEQDVEQDETVNDEKNTEITNVSEKEIDKNGFEKIENNTTNKPKDSGNKNRTPKPIQQIEKSKEQKIKTSEDIAFSGTNERNQSSSPISKSEENDNKLDNLEGSTTSSKPLQLVEVLSLLETKESLVDIKSTLPDTLLSSVVPFTSLEKKETKGSTKNKGFYAGLMIAPTYTDRKIKVTGNPVISRLINMDEKASTSFAFGINVGYKISNNWSVETGFAYSKLTIRHNGRKQVRHTAVGEQINDQGELEQKYNFDVGTSGGDVETELTLTRNSSVTIPENDFINLRIKARQNIVFGSIPLIIRYQIGEGKWRGGLKTGIVNRFVLDGNLQIESVDVLRPGLRPILNDRFYEPRKLRRINKYAIDFLVGASLSYSLRDNLWVSLEPTITRSINPIFENQHFKTFPVVSSLDFGISYLF